VDDGCEYCDLCGKHAYNCRCYPAYDPDRTCRGHVDYDDYDEWNSQFESPGQEVFDLAPYDRSGDDGIICFPSGPCPVRWCRRMDPHMHADSGIVPVPD
jgi:hypothetical protein